MIIELFPNPPESYITNCLIRGRDYEDDVPNAPAMFQNYYGAMSVHLDRYAIIPLEQYVPIEDHEELVQKYEDLLRKLDNCPF